MDKLYWSGFLQSMTDEQFHRLSDDVAFETKNRLFLANAPGLTPEEFLDLQAGNIVAAIRAYRERNACSIYAAKTIIDRKRDAIRAIEAERDKADREADK
jgi:hypothetical protein